jgi:hypothetical protein
LFCFVGAAAAFALTTILAFASVVTGRASAFPFATVLSFAVVLLLLVEAVVGDLAD